MSQPVVTALGTVAVRGRTESPWTFLPEGAVYMDDPRLPLPHAHAAVSRPEDELALPRL